MKRICVLFPLILAGCSSQSAPATPPAPAVVVSTPPPMPSGTLSVSTPNSASPNMATAIETPTAEAVQQPDNSQSAAPSTVVDFPVPEIANSGFAHTYANDVTSRIDASTTSGELIEIRGYLAQTTLAFQDGSAKAGLNGESERRVLDDRVVDLNQVLQEYARNKSDLIAGDVSEDRFNLIQRGNMLAINNKVPMVDNYRDANFK